MNNETQTSSPYLGLKLTLRDSLNISSQPGEGQRAQIEDPCRGKHFQLGPQELSFARELDGQRTVGQVGDALGLSQDYAEMLAIKLIQLGLVDGVAAEGVLKQRQSSKRFQAILKRNPLSFKISFGHPGKILNRLKPLGELAFSPLFLVVWGIVILLAGKLAIENWSQIQATTIHVLAPSHWLGLIVVWLVLKVIHELGHGLAAQKYGVEVRDSGALVLLFTPLAYVDVSGIWKLESRRQRMIVVAAGMYVELLFAAVALMAWAWMPVGPISTLCIKAFLMGTVTTVLFNANPLMRFDGYYLLAEAIDIPNLYQKGSNWFNNTWKNLLLGMPVTQPACREDEQRIVRIYGALAFLWKISIVLSLTLGSIVLWPGFGLVFGLIAILTWLLIPLGMAIANVVKRRAEIDQQRATMTGGVAGFGIVILFFVLQGPASRAVPAIVQFEKDFRVRSPLEGFVEEIKVENGQAVQIGQPLFRLTNAALATELEQARCDIEKAEVQIRMHRSSGEHNLATAEKEKLRVFRKQELELLRKQASLTVVAPITGTIVHHGLQQQLGQYVKQGDVLLTIADPDNKKVVISVDQKQEEALKRLVNQNVKLVFPSRSTFLATVNKVDPRATTIPKFMELTAVKGGMIAVRPVDQKDNQTSTHEFLMPRVRAEIELPADAHDKLFPGERGMAVIPVTTQSLGRYACSETWQWLNRKLDRVKEIRNAGN